MGDEFVSYDGMHLQGMDVDACVYKCSDYSMPYYVYRASSQQCWCKTVEGYEVGSLTCVCCACVVRACVFVCVCVCVCLLFVCCVCAVVRAAFAYDCT